MVSLLDTSAVVAALMPAHPRHAWARPYFGAEGASVCAHTLAELYAVLTASPQFRMAPEKAARAVEGLATRLKVVPLEPDMYLRSSQRLAALGVGGGAIYDALIAEATLSVKATQLVTLNAKHFVRLGKDIAGLVVTAEQ
ncbi:PIN domain-containing protein [Deinococcus sp.]|uniref:PIN domain-containing protein n=1 Tax=Deinococcus sp. TaxID=47478 RepID=UPI003C7B5163